MNSNFSLLSSLPRRGITIISGYRDQKIDAYVALYDLNTDNSLVITLPKGHHFLIGQGVTLHLDNRTGVSEYDEDLRVYRTSYRGTVLSVETLSVYVKPDEFMIYYSDKCIGKYVSQSYSYDQFDSCTPLPESTATDTDLDWDDGEHENKVGVLITRSPSRPHTSLMAFLSNNNDEIFLITFKGLFKSRALHYSNNCCFAIDHRAEFVFEKAYDWNYTIIEAEAYKISNENSLFKKIQFHFVEKNPWETSFFLSPDIEMFHLKPKRILLPDTL